MKPEFINNLVDQLLARDSEYRPLELLLLLRRLDRDGLARFDSDPNVFLEDQLYGNLDTVMEQLNWAATRARTLGLEARTRPRRSGQGAMFRRSTADHQARTSWQRTEVSAQADLFLDNRLSVARSQLVRALEAADRAGAETALLELSRADPGNELQADAEHLVGALGWLDVERLDAPRVMDAIEGDLAIRARRLLGASAAEQFLARFFQHLADYPSQRSSAQDSVELSPAQLRFKAGDMAGVLREIDRLESSSSSDAMSSALRLVDIRASLRLGDRDRALRNLSLLCWSDPKAAEDWLELGEDDELSRRVEQFWDLEKPLEIELFPAWLLARGYPMPSVDQARDFSAARALEGIRTLRMDPADIDARQWMHDHFPGLMEHWMGQR